MNNEHYLYAAEVKGIQEYILKSSKLKAIVEASNKVEYICTDAFKDLFKDYDINRSFIELEANDEIQIVVMAAGKITCIFKNRELCEFAVEHFPRKIMTLAPGITLCQAVVKMSDNYSSDIKKLEANLRIQRNIPSKSLTIGVMGILRSRETEELVEVKDTKNSSSNTYKINISLCQKAFGINTPIDNTTLEIGKIAGEDSWVAVIHADGNGLGEIVKYINESKSPNEMSEFSAIISSATVNAAQKSFNKIQDRLGSGILPIRPIVLNGDDVTIICRADLALPYTKALCEFFERETEEAFKSKDWGKSKLTMSAGISYIKAKYPYYYAYELSEKLCSYAKKQSRKVDTDNKPSCIMFHKVADSFYEDYESIKRRELSLPRGGSWSYGPYFLDNRMGVSIDKLIDDAAYLSEHSALWSALRQWITYMYDDYGEHQGRADLFLQNIYLKYTTRKGKDYVKELTESIQEIEEDSKYLKYPTLDIITIATMNSCAPIL